jgi:membrane-associated phospholipid phosphatase
MTRSIAVTLLMAFEVSRAWAQTSPNPPPPDNSIRAVPKTMLRQEWRMWSSPFRRSSYDSKSVKKYIIPFALISVALLATDHKTADYLPNTTDQTLWSSRVSKLGAWYSLAGVSGSTYLVGKLAGDNHAKEAGLLALEALGHAQVFVFAMKQVTNRQRPYQNDGTGSFWKGGNSFPSGHAASSFAVATIFAREYRDHIAVPIVAYSLATAISISRIGAQRHWVSDIFVGGSMGFLIGRYTYRQNHDRSLPGTKVSGIDKLMPQVGLGPRGPALSWVF